MSVSAIMVLVGHGLSVLSFVALICIILLGRRASPVRGPVLLAAGGTILWSIITVGMSVLVDRPVIVPLVEWLKISIWLWLTASLLSEVSREQVTIWRLAKTGIAIPFLLIAGLTVLNVAGVGLLDLQTVNLIQAVAFMGMSVLGLALVETLSRRLGDGNRRAVRFYVLSVGLLFSIDLFLFATLLLLGQIDGTIFAIRGFCLVVVPPMLALAFARQREWVVDVHVSRDVVVNAATLLGAGLYLLTMALAGFAARELNVTWGPLLHLVFLAGAILLLIAIISSERLAPKLRNWVSRNFFSAKYDYRREWMQFSDALASHGRMPVEERILDGVLQSLQCQSGGLWLRLEDGAGYALAAARPRSAVFESPDVRIISERLTSTGRAIDLQQSAAPTADLPFRRPWVAAPIVHRGDMAGFLVLAEPPSDVTPNPEDLELLKALSVQSAVHLAEERSAAALGRTERFEGIARRLTYVGHDLKNIVSQISMVIQNWERHRDNPVFMQQLPSTLESAVTRMKGLVEGVQEVKERKCTDETVDLSSCLSDLMVLWRVRHANITKDINVAGARVRARLEHVQSVLDQLVSNAIEASGARNTVRVSAGRTDGEAWCEIEDSGCGMSANVVAGSHFRVVNSGKPQGFGVGLFQVRDYVQQIGGRLSFKRTDVGGTCARVVFPTLSRENEVDKSVPLSMSLAPSGGSVAHARVKT